MGYIGSEAELDIELRHAPERVWAAVIASGAVDFSDWVDVVIPNLDGNGGDLRWQDVRWQPRDGNLLPKRGDECVVILDDNNEFWIPVWWPANPVLNYGTTLPSSPYNGQEYTLVDSVTLPNYQWRFRYNANHTGDAYKWEYVGGAAWVAVDSTTQSIPTATWLKGFTLSIPRNGFYVIQAWSDNISSISTSTAVVHGFGLNSAGSPITSGYGVIFSPAGIAQGLPPITGYAQITTAPVNFSHFMNAAGSGLSATRRVLSIIPQSVI
jgi:hypothetical protein